MAITVVVAIIVPGTMGRSVNIQHGLFALPQFLSQSVSCQKSQKSSQNLTRNPNFSRPYRKMMRNDLQRAITRSWFQDSKTSWWYTYSSEKYESQL